MEIDDLTVLRSNYRVGCPLICLAPLALRRLTFPVKPIHQVAGEDENATARSSDMLEMKRVIWAAVPRMLRTLAGYSSAALFSVMWSGVILSHTVPSFRLCAGVEEPFLLRGRWI